MGKRSLVNLFTLIAFGAVFISYSQAAEKSDSQLGVKSCEHCGFLQSEINNRRDEIRRLETLKKDNQAFLDKMGEGRKLSKVAKLGSNIMMISIQIVDETEKLRDLENSVKQERCKERCHKNANIKES